MISQKVRELLNARHADIESEIQLYRVLNAMLQKNTSFSNVQGLAEELEEYLVDTLDIDLEEVEEEEDSLEDGILSAFQKAQGELGILMTIDRNLAQLKNAGAFEEELEGQKKFKERLQEQIFNRYNITEEDLKEGEENE